MEQKRFEVGKTYTEDDTNKIGIEIKVLSRTEKTITFIYTKKNWWKQEIDKEYRRKIQTYSREYEMIELGNHWSSPSIYAINQVS